MRRPTHPPPHPIEPRVLWLALAALLAAGGLYALGYWPTANVQQRFTGRNPDQQRAAAWLWLDAAAAVNDAITHGQFTAWLNVAPGTRLYLENSAAATLDVTVNDQPLYHGTADVDLATVTGDIRLNVTYTLPAALTPRGVIGLMQRTPLAGDAIVPAWDYLPLAPAPRLAIPAWLGSLARTAALPAVAFGLALALAALRLSRRVWLILAAITALALAVRLISLSQKFTHDPTLWTMEKVWDNYALMGRGWLGGDVIVGGNAFQQGTFVYLGMAQMALGPALAPLYVLNTVLGSFAPPLIVLAAWALFGAVTGTAAGTLAALFAPLIHYQQTLQDVAPVTLLLFGLTLACAGMFRYRLRVCGVLAGAAVGLAGDMRSSMLALLVWPMLIALFGFGSWPDRLRGAALTVLAAALCVLPITLDNFRVGVPALTANLADYQLFRSNNLDSTGMNTYETQSEKLAVARGDSWSAALRRELARDPGHAAQLVLRRLALFFDPVEHSDSAMIDYETTGRGASALLNALSLGDAVTFRLLMLLALIGIGLTVHQRRAETLLLSAGLGMYIASLAAFYVIGRVRTPIAAFESPLAAAGLVGLWRIARAWRLVGRGARRYSLIVIASAGLLTYALSGLADRLPTAPILAADARLPADLLPIRAAYGGEVRLLGMAYYASNARPGGYLSFELFWQAIRPPTRDYVASVRLLDNATGSLDDAPTSVQNFLIGSQRPPELPTSRWPPGAIYDERYVIQLPDPPSAPNMSSLAALPSYSVLIGVYDRDAARLLSVAEASAPVLDNHVRLTAFGLRRDDLPTLPALSGDPAYVWGTSIAARDASCAVGQDGLMLSITWQTLHERPDLPLTLFAHAIDPASGALLGQRDAPPDAHDPTDAWLPGTLHTTRWQLDGLLSGSYPSLSVQIGLYDFAGTRLSVTRGGTVQPDGVVTLACR